MLARGQQSFFQAPPQRGGVLEPGHLGRLVVQRVVVLAVDPVAAVPRPVVLADLRSVRPPHPPHVHRLKVPPLEYADLATVYKLPGDQFAKSRFADGDVLLPQPPNRVAQQHTAFRGRWVIPRVQCFADVAPPHQWFATM